MKWGLNLQLNGSNILFFSNYYKKINQNIDFARINFGIECHVKLIFSNAKAGPGVKDKPPL
jgi:hypothetical protein